MPCNIDAATVWSDFVYFFKGEQLWMWHYNKEQLIEGPVSTDTWNVEDNIDVAVQWFVKKKVYIFKRLKYWRTDKNKNIEAVSPVSEGWPNLLESALFPDCACDCMDGQNRVDWKFDSMNFDLNLGHTKLQQESQIEEKVVDSRDGKKPEKDFTVFRKVVETESFTHFSGITLKAGTRFNTTVPHSINQKINLAVVAGLTEFQFGIKKETSTEKSKSVTCPSFTDMKVTCRVTLQTQELVVPYTMTLQHVYRDCKCVTKGSYSKVSFSDIHLSVNQSSKD